jgi:hypothetical protein
VQRLALHAKHLVNAQTNGRSICEEIAMATTQQVAPPTQKKGCSTIVVLMIASLSLVVGVLAGAAFIIVFMQFDPSIATNLGIELEAEVPATPIEVIEEPEAAAAKADYALLYPIEESLRVEGELDPEKVKRQVKESRYQMRQCYQDGMNKDPDLKGEMGLQFTVSQSGKVLAALERHTDFASEDVKKCIVKEIRSWSFPGKYKALSVVKFDVLMIPISSAAAGASEQ